MSRDTFITTPWRDYDKNMHMRVKYGMHYLEGNRLPYFSITCDIRDDSKDVGGGAAHEEIARVFPELAPLIKWHLCDQDGTPMHYRANAMYWYGMAAGWQMRGPYDKDPIGCFVSTAIVDPCYDASIYNDTTTEERIKLSLSARELGEWLDARLPRVQAEFRAAMQAAHVAMIDI